MFSDFVNYLGTVFFYYWEVDTHLFALRVTPKAVWNSYPLLEVNTTKSLPPPFG